MENICIYSYRIEKVRIKNFMEMLDKNKLKCTKMCAELCTINLMCDNNKKV